jgi:hypothetical protein
MKRKLVIIALAAALALLAFPHAALAADGNGDGYDDNDFSKLQTFLNLPSIIPGQSNGQCLNPAYDPMDTATWTGVVWTDDVSKLVISIGEDYSWQYKSFAGALDLSGFTALRYVNCAGFNHLTSLDITGDSALTTLYCFDSRLADLDISTNSNLRTLNCSDNPLGALDISANIALTDLYCQNNQLAALDVSHAISLYYLDCSRNQLTALDTSANDLAYLFCNDNNLSTLDVSANTGLTTLNLSGNPLLDIKANVAGKSITLHANTGGYVGLFGSIDESVLNAIGAPQTNMAFLSWTSAGTPVSTDAAFPLTGGTDFDLTASFIDQLVLEPSQPRDIYTGGRITITPNIPGGTWDYPHDMLSGDFSGEGAVFTGLKSGTAHVTYTAGNQTISYDIVIKLADMPTTGQDFTPAMLLLALAICLGGAAFALVLLGRRRKQAR